MSACSPLEKGHYATLLSAYALTLPSMEEAIDHFYQALDEALRHIPGNDKVFLLGDFNARVQNNLIWSGVLGRLGTGQVSAKGMRLLSLCAGNNLTITVSAKYKNILDAPTLQALAPTGLRNSEVHKG